MSKRDPKNRESYSIKIDPEFLCGDQDGDLRASPHPPPDVGNGSHCPYLFKLPFRLFGAIALSLTLASPAMATGGDVGMHRGYRYDGHVYVSTRGTELASSISATDPVVERRQPRRVYAFCVRGVERSAWRASAW